MSGRVERFVGGAVGEPGERVFLIEAVVEGEAAAYLIEKIQVAALAEQAQELLRERGMVGTGLGLDPGGVHGDTPVVFRVGGLQLVAPEQSDVVLLTMLSVEDGDEPVTYELTLGQLDAFARAALDVVAAGRPPCPRCGLPMDPDGHHCPRSNGDLRGHRP